MASFLSGVNGGVPPTVGTGVAVTACAVLVYNIGKCLYKTSSQNTC